MDRSPERRPQPCPSASDFCVNDDPLVVVSSYTRFDNLAHGPRGTEAKLGMTTYRLNTNDGSLTKLAISNGVVNPAFLRWHKTENVLYGCTESVKENGQVVAWNVCPESGQLKEIGRVDAGGTSTCYLTFDRTMENILTCNYWDSTLGVCSMYPDGHLAKKLHAKYDPKAGEKMNVSADNHVNHSLNDASAQADRQRDPHSHAIVFEPHFGVVAYVPDLGKDVIRELHYDAKTGKMEPLGVIPSGLASDGPHGPRYIEFHNEFNVCYVVNELSSTVAVFHVDTDALAKLATKGIRPTQPTIRYIQTISTIPSAFPKSINTCGRVAIHNSGKYLLCSNRGHDSVAVFRIQRECAFPGLLTTVGIEHTRGMTPRHFQFDPSGQWLVAATQDSDKVGVFRFNLASGKITWSSNQYEVPSPNFVCCLQPHVRANCEGVVPNIAQIASLVSEYTAPGTPTKSSAPARRVQNESPAKRRRVA